ncbi:MAG: hypothetical protein QHH00_08370, partial [Methanomassiliicoccales archaeon]|nr:hypothetical protein [Methanomassiliicoccales archaeon]
MEIIAKYSFNGGLEYIQKNHPAEFEEVKDIISKVDASRFKTKISKEKTMPGKIFLYSPKDLKRGIQRAFSSKG